MFILIEWWNSILKMDIREVFLMNPKHQYPLSLWGECVYVVQSWKERRLLCESKFIPIESRTSILQKAIRDVFVMKPKHQYH